MLWINFLAWVITCIACLVFHAWYALMALNGVGFIWVGSVFFFFSERGRELDWDLSLIPQTIIYATLILFSLVGIHWPKDPDGSGFLETTVPIIMLLSIPAFFLSSLGKRK